MPFRILIICSIFFLSFSFYEKHGSDQFSIGIISLDGEHISDSQIAATALETFYNCRVIYLPAVAAPESLYWNSSDTLNPGAVIDFLVNSVSYDSVDFIMAMTEHPMYLGGFSDYWKKHGFIRGLATRKGRSSIVSISNIKKIIEHDPGSYEKFLSKVVRHEIGHNLGLEHCKSESRCAMVGSFDIETLLNARLSFCDSCAQIINDYIRK